MIQKILCNEYLKRYDNMNAEERRILADRVGQWLRSGGRILSARADDPSSRLQSVMQLGSGWNDAECQAWMDGVKLLTAFVGKEETWLPDMLYVKAARRSIRQIVKCLSESARKAAEPAAPAAAAAQKQLVGKSYAGKVVIKAKAVDAVSGDAFPAEKKSGYKPLSKIAEPVAAVRPRHIDQYVHLLPKQTQEKAATVRGLLRELDMARENARRLMDAGDHPDKIAQWAKTATRLDNKVKAIYRELDEEWDKLVKTGRVAVDVFGNAHVTEPAEKAGVTETAEGKAAKDGGEKKPARRTKTPEEKAAAKALREEKKKAENQRKAAQLRKWLIDKRNAKTPEQSVKWRDRYDEMVKVGGEEAVTDKVREAAEYYGIELSEK